MLIWNLKIIVKITKVGKKLLNLIFLKMIAIMNVQKNRIQLKKNTSGTLSHSLRNTKSFPRCSHFRIS